MVPAVPNCWHAPAVGHVFDETEKNSFSVDLPQFKSLRLSNIASHERSPAPADITPPGITSEGKLSLAADIRCAGSDLSHEAMKTIASQSVDLAWISIMYAMNSRDGSDNPIAGDPCATPSHMSVTVNSAGRIPDSIRPSLAAPAKLPRWLDPGWLSPALLWTITWGFERSSLVQPIPR